MSFDSNDTSLTNQHLHELSCDQINYLSFLTPVNCCQIAKMDLHANLYNLNNFSMLTCLKLVEKKKPMTGKQDIMKTG